MEEEKKEEKGKLHRTAKAQVDAEAYNNNKKCDWIYRYTTHKQSLNSPTKIKYKRLTQWTKETQNYNHQNETN